MGVGVCTRGRGKRPHFGLSCSIPSFPSLVDGPFPGESFSRMEGELQQKEGPGHEEALPVEPCPRSCKGSINIPGRGNACCRSSHRCSGSSPWTESPSQAGNNRWRWMQGDSKPSADTQAFGRMQGSVQGQGGSLGLQPGGTRSVAQRWEQSTADVEPPAHARRLKRLGVFFPHSHH